MFAEPDVNDHLNQVRQAFERGRRRIDQGINQVYSNAAKAGAFGGSRMYLLVVEALESEFDTTVREVLGELKRSLRTIKVEPSTLRSLTQDEFELFTRGVVSAARDRCRNPGFPQRQKQAEAIVVPAAELLMQRLSTMLRQFDVGFLDNADPEAVSVTNNSLNIGTNIGAIQQGGHGSTQNSSVTLSMTDIRKAVEIFEQELAAMQLPDEPRQTLVADLATVRAQLSKPNHSSTILAEVGRSIRSVVEGIGAGMLTPSMIAAANSLAAALGAA